MVSNRLIGRLDIKGEWVVKGIQMDGLRRMGNPEEIAQAMSESGADELLLVDVVASLYNRENIYSIIQYVANNLRIPLTVVGGIKNLDNAARIFDSGADKIGINTAGIKDPKIFESVANKYGSQAMVASIEAKREPKMHAWRAMSDNGRTASNLSVNDWCRTLMSLGVGEVLVTSIDSEGMQRGPDLELMQAIAETIDVPLVYSGGVRNSLDCSDLLKMKVDAIALASAIHYKQTTFEQIKIDLAIEGFRIRNAGRVS